MKYQVVWSLPVSQSFTSRTLQDQVRQAVDAASQQMKASAYMIEKSWELIENIHHDSGSSETDFDTQN